MNHAIILIVDHDSDAPQSDDELRQQLEQYELTEWTNDCNSYDYHVVQRESFQDAYNDILSNLAQDISKYWKDYFTGHPYMSLTGVSVNPVNTGSFKRRLHQHCESAICMQLALKSIGMRYHEPLPTDIIMIAYSVEDVIKFLSADLCQTAFDHMIKFQNNPLVDTKGPLGSPVNGAPMIFGFGTSTENLNSFAVGGYHALLSMTKTVNIFLAMTEKMTVGNMTTRSEIHSIMPWLMNDMNAYYANITDEEWPAKLKKWMGTQRWPNKID